MIAEQLDVEAEDITMETRFKEDLEADSLDLFELVSSLEDEYGIDIPSEDLDSLTTVGAIVDYLKELGRRRVRLVGNMKTRITELFGIEYPIIQGGMAWVADYHLAAAVSEAGGLGLIGAASAPEDVIRQQIREAKKLTDKPFGVNVMLMSPLCGRSGKGCCGRGREGRYHRRRESR